MLWLRHWLKVSISYNILDNIVVHDRHYVSQWPLQLQVLGATRMSFEQRGNDMVKKPHEIQ